MWKTSSLHVKDACNCSYEEVCQAIDDCSQGYIASNLTFLGLITMWECIVCPWDKFSKWHKRECVMGDRDLCGVDNLPICPIEEGVFKCHGEMETLFYGTNCYQKWKGKKETKICLQVYCF